MKKVAIILALLVFVIVSPVYAQDPPPPPSQSGNNGFFATFTQFFSRMFGTGATKPSENNQPMMRAQEMMATSSGKPQMDPQEGRLNGLVQAGKITDSQKALIIAKMQQIQSELKSWAQSNGIDPQYVSIMPPMGMPQGPMNQSTESGQVRPYNQPGMQKPRPNNNQPNGIMQQQPNMMMNQTPR